MAPLTPDFYDYEWLAPEEARLDGRFIHLRWPDGARLTALDRWLFESAVGLGADPATREGLVDPAHHGSQTVLTAASVTDGALEVTFAGDQTARLHPGWLHHVATGQHRASSWLPEPVSWTAADMPSPVDHDGPAVLAGGDALAAWLNDLIRCGLARLRGLPDDPNISLHLGTLIGAIRDTNFGPIWDVKADVTMAGTADANSTANSSLRLGPHTDLPTRETPPGFQFLHCLVNETEGGYSTMTDGLALVDALQSEYPDHYEALTTLRWVFFNRGPGLDHRWSGPMIDHGVDGSPLTLRAFYPVRGFPDMAPEDMPRAYDAMAVFSAMAADSRFQIRYPFIPGDMVGFDNRRILHGRDAFESGGARHLRGVYIDHDEVRSATRVANRRMAAANRSNQTDSSRSERTRS